jgi:hypothetical protein
MTGKGSDIGVGLVSVGWMGKLHSRAYQALPSVEVVSICAPNALHHEIGLAAAEAGKPFWIEKPVGRDARDRRGRRRRPAGRDRHHRRLQLPPRPGRRAPP